MYKALEWLDGQFDNVVTLIRIVLSLWFTYAVFNHYGLLLASLALIVFVMGELIGIMSKKMSELSESESLLWEHVERTTELLNTAAKFIHVHQADIENLKKITESRRKKAPNDRLKAEG